eukprot:2604729-Prymnesium_polylepis.1
MLVRRLRAGARRARRGHKLLLPEVGEGAVAEVVHQPGETNALDIRLGNAQLWLRLLEVGRPRARKVADAQRVLESIVHGGREDPRAGAKLTYAAQPLELGCVDDQNAQRVELNGSVDHVGESASVALLQERRAAATSVLTGRRPLEGEQQHVRVAQHHSRGSNFGSNGRWPMMSPVAVSGHYARPA